MRIRIYKTTIMLTLANPDSLGIIRKTYKKLEDIFDEIQAQAHFTILYFFTFTS